MHTCHLFTWFKALAGDAFPAISLVRISWHASQYIINAFYWLLLVDVLSTDNTEEQPINTGDNTPPSSGHG